MHCDYIVEFTRLSALLIYYISEHLVLVLCLLDYSIDEFDFRCVGPVNWHSSQGQERAELVWETR